MPLDPPLQRLVDAAAGSPPPAPPADLDERRRQANTTMLFAHTGPQEGVEVADHVVPVDGGEIRVRTYRPAALAAPMPTFFFIHGGGWFQGNLDTAEVECGPMASMVPCFVASVEYRLSPEHPFPTPLEDCVAAYEWLLSSAEELGVDASRIAIGGTSAGGNLAAALCVAARERGLPMPIAQLLDAPCLDLTLASPSIKEHGQGGGLTEAGVREYASFYVPDAAELTNPLVSPLHAEDLSGLPPAVIVVAELDPVRDDGERYLTRLHAAGVPGAGFRVQAQFHGGWIVPITATWRLVGDLRASALRRAFDGTLVPTF
jgi:acetyl esterase